MMSKSAARVVARVARRTATMRQSATVMEYFCPLDADAKRRAREPGLPHLVEVWHRAGQSPTAAEVDAAFVEHLTAEFDEDRCPHVSAS